MIIYPLLVSAQLVLVADTVPQINADVSCRPAVAEALVNRSADACRNDEMTARQTLADKWDSFPEKDRAVCRRMIGMGGSPSYVELLTCLELAQQTRGFKDARAGTSSAPADVTTGSAVKP